MVVSGTIAPTRDIPELTAEDTIRIILSNLNLVVPVVAALLVIIIAIIVICVLRNKGNNNKGIIIFLFLSYPLQTNLPLCYRYRSSNCNTKNTHTRSRFIQKKIKKNAIAIHRRNLKKKSGTIAPNVGSIQPGVIYPPWIPHWIDLNVMVPLIATIIVVAVGVLVICVAISRRRDDDPRCGPKDVYCRFWFHGLIFTYGFFFSFKTCFQLFGICYRDLNLW